MQLEVTTNWKNQKCPVLLIWLSIVIITQLETAIWCLRTKELRLKCLIKMFYSKVWAHLEIQRAEHNNLPIKKEHRVIYSKPFKIITDLLLTKDTTASQGWVATPDKEAVHLTSSKNMVRWAIVQTQSWITIHKTTANTKAFQLSQLKRKLLRASQETLEVKIHAEVCKVT